MRHGTVLFAILFVACGGSTRRSSGSERSVDEASRPRPAPAVGQAGAGQVEGTVSIGGPGRSDEPTPSDVVEEVIRRHAAEVSRCYRTELVARPTLAGRVLVEFLIGEDGLVREAAVARSELGAPRAEQCIVQAIRSWSFEEVPGEDAMLIRYPFDFSPGGG
jgi:TonB family protein